MSDQEISEVERDEARKRVLNRLKRARGQLDGVIRAVEEERSCRDVITQLSACTSALNRAGFTIISSAMKECDAGQEGGVEEGQLTLAELEKLFLSLA